MDWKEHKHVMRDIRKYVDVLGESNLGPSKYFIESTYISVQGKELPQYLLTKMGCELVANKMIGKDGIIFTAKYVDKFNEMEQQVSTISEMDMLALKILNSNSKEEKLIALDSYKQCIETETTNKIVEEQVKPLEEEVNTLFDTDNAISMLEYSKIINIGRTQLFKVLREMEILNSNNLPYKQYMQYFEVNNVVKNGYTYPTTRINGKGQRYIYKRLKEKEII